MSFVSSLTWELLPNCNAACSTFTKSFFFLTSSLWTLPKFLWLHWVNSVPHLAIFFITWTLGSQWNGALQTTSTVRPHPLSESHISSNRNGFKIGGGSRPFGTIQIGTWSKMVLWRWKTHVPTNRWSQSLVQKTLSRLSPIWIDHLQSVCSKWTWNSNIQDPRNYMHPLPLEKAASDYDFFYCPLIFLYFRATH